MGSAESVKTTSRVRYCARNFPVMYKQKARIDRNNSSLSFRHTNNKLNKVEAFFHADPNFAQCYPLFPDSNLAYIDTRSYIVQNSSMSSASACTLIIVGKQDNPVYEFDFGAKVCPNWAHRTLTLFAARQLCAFIAVCYSCSIRFSG